MAEITIQEITPAGINPTFTAAAGGGDYFIPTARSRDPHILFVVNGGVSSITVEVDDPTSESPTAAQSFDPDLGVSVPNGDDRMVLIDPRRFVDTVTGRVNITYSGVSSVTVAVLLAPQS